MTEMSTCITIEYELLITRLKIFAFCDGVKLEHHVHVLFNKIITHKGCASYLNYTSITLQRWKINRLLLLLLILSLRLTVCFEKKLNNNNNKTISNCNSISIHSGSNCCQFPLQIPEATSQAIDEEEQQPSESPAVSVASKGRGRGRQGRSKRSQPSRSAALEACIN